MALKYKAGDQVRIKSLDWYNKNIKNNGIIICGSESFTHPMSHFCGKVVTIVTIQDDCYRILEDDGDWYWTDEMIEGLVEEETKPKYEDEVNGEYYSTPKYLVRPSGYQFVDENGNVINAMKIVLEKKNKEYPKTYEECCGVLGYSGNYNMILTTDVDNKLFNALYRLKVCRDAYWKIAGEEMGLGKPWENGRCEVVYGICRDYDDIVKQDDYWGGAHIFEFPIREMRDAFYENFKEEIEICKELL